MKIVVLLKRTPDTEAKIKFTAGHGKIDDSELQYILNPYDEFAIEEALQTRDKVAGSEVIACSYGGEVCREIVVKALAMGADRGIIVGDDCQRDPLAISKILAKVVEQQQAELVFCGKQGIDDDNMLVGVMVAEFLGWPHVNVVNNFVLNDGVANIEREVEGGQVEVYETRLPVVIGANKALNSPRYVSLPGIMKAKRKPLVTVAVSELGLELAEPQSEIVAYRHPPAKPTGKVFKDKPVDEMVSEVVKLLRNEAKVI